MQAKHPNLTLLLVALSLCTLSLHAQAQAPAAPPAAPANEAKPSEAKPSAAATAKPEKPAQASAKPAADKPGEKGANEPANAGSPGAAGEQGRAWIAHLPLASAPLDDIRLQFDVRGNDLAGEIVVYFRPFGAKGELRSVRAKRDEKSFFALVPAESVDSDGIEYWVVERSPQGQERAVFASSAQPQPVFVYVDSAGAREQRLLRMADGRRSRLGAKFDWVDMGGFRVSDPNVSDAHDHYYHLEGQYAYRFFRGVEELEFALGRLDGRLLNTDTLQRKRVALEYGRTAITFAFGEWFRLRPGVLLGISTTGFEAGLDLAAIVGDRDGTEFELSGGYVTSLGARVRTRLGWCTVPRLPMGASIEVTNFPSNDDFGVRLLFDIGYRAQNGFMVRALAGYRGRTSLAGGPSLGVETGYAF